MSCPTCQPRRLPGATVPTTRCETHSTATQDAKFPSLTTFNSEQLKLALYLVPILPRECHHSFEACRHAALNAFAGFKKLTDFHAFRYKAMCPQSDEPVPPGQFSAFFLHATSIDHLFNWPAHDTEDVSHPPRKIPAEILSFCVHRSAYETYASRFQNAVEQYTHGFYATYLRTKASLENAIDNSTMGEMNRRMWRHFWRDRFLYENEKWEVDLGRLVLPSWDEIVEEVYWAILERVEGAANLDGLGRGSGGEGGEVIEDGDGCEEEEEGVFSAYDEVASVLNEDIGLMSSVWDDLEREFSEDTLL